MKAGSMIVSQTKREMG